MMSESQNFSEWFLRTVIAGGFAVIGFFGQERYATWKDKREQEEATFVKIMELSSLLDESLSIFVSQNYQAQRLCRMLVENHGAEVVPKGLGYNDTIFQMYDKFTDAEAELQSIIRSTTINSQRRVNQQMSEWIEKNIGFKTSNQPTQERKRLAEQLVVLELHLNQWLDKYKATIPEADDPKNRKRTLVYLADEHEHGTGFPTGIEQLVQDVIKSWK